MDKKSRQALREKVVLHLLEADTGVTQAEVLAFGVQTGLPPEETLLEELEGMVQDGLIRWDGSSYSLHSEGRKLATRAKKKRGGADVKEVEVAPEPAQDHAHPHAHAHAEPEAAEDHPHAHEPAAPAPEPAQDHAHPHAHEHAEPAPQAREEREEQGGGHSHSHDHGGGHGHSHDHGEARTERVPPPRPKPAPSRPAPPPPKAGLRQLLKTMLKRLLRME